MSQDPDFQRLKDSVRAGRVSHTGFLEADKAAELVARLRQADISVTVSGGYPGANRRIVTVFPETIPEATTPLAALFFPDLAEDTGLVAGLRKQIDASEIGDSLKYQQGFVVIVLAKAKARLSETINIQGRELNFEDLTLEHLAGSRKRQQVIVPSLRVDALGAKAFNVSRSYFTKGIAAGNVTINGKRAEKSSSAEAGDEIYAQSIGRMYLNSVQGETRRGNLKVLIDIEKA